MRRDVTDVYPEGTSWRPLWENVTDISVNHLDQVCYNRQIYTSRKESLMNFPNVFPHDSLSPYRLKAHNGIVPKKYLFGYYIKAKITTETLS